MGKRHDSSYICKLLVKSVKFDALSLKKNKIVPLRLTLLGNYHYPHPLRVMLIWVIWVIQDYMECGGGDAFDSEFTYYLFNVGKNSFI